MAIGELLDAAIKLYRLRWKTLIDFSTWHSLARQGLGDDGAVEAMVTMVGCLRAPRS